MIYLAYNDIQGVNAPVAGVGLGLLAIIVLWIFIGSGKD